MKHLLSPLDRLSTLGIQLRKGWKQFATFMVLHPQPSPSRPKFPPNESAHPNAAHSYVARARFYPYLPTREEQQDWLDKIYGQSK
jgi:hypothetical protein